MFTLIFTLYFQVVIDTLFLCVCEDKNINGEMWHKSPIIKLSKPKKQIVKNSNNI
jgi:hypothetical protein